MNRALQALGLLCFVPALLPCQTLNSHASKRQWQTKSAQQNSKPVLRTFYFESEIFCIDEVFSRWSDRNAFEWIGYLSKLRDFEEKNNSNIAGTTVLSSTTTESTSVHSVSTRLSLSTRRIGHINVNVCICKKNSFKVEMNSDICYIHTGNDISLNIHTSIKLSILVPTSPDPEHYDSETDTNKLMEGRFWECKAYPGLKSHGKFVFIPLFDLTSRKLFQYLLDSLLVLVLLHSRVSIQENEFYFLTIFPGFLFLVCRRGKFPQIIRLVFVSFLQGVNQISEYSIHKLMKKLVHVFHCTTNEFLGLFPCLAPRKFPTSLTFCRLFQRVKQISEYSIYKIEESPCI